jgi:putative transcriptional regulator
MRMHRARLRMSQGELGDKVHLSTNSISAIEQGHTDPKVSMVKKIAKVLGVRVSYLIGEDKESEGVPAAVA